MTAALTLSLYIVRQFAASVTSMLLALSGLVAMFDFIELLRRSASHPDATFGVVSQIAALRLPYVGMQILPFAVLRGGARSAAAVSRSARPRMFVQAEVSVAQAERTFGVRLVAEHTRGGAEYLAPASLGRSARTAPASLPVPLQGLATGVVGLDTSPVIQTAEQPTSAYLPRSGTARGCHGGTSTHGFTPNQYLDAYGLSALHSAGLRGAGQRVAVIEISGFKRSDIDAFGRCFHIHVPPIRTVGVGLRHLLGPGPEAPLDLEVLTSAAPRLASLDVYENPNNAARLLEGFTAPLVAPGAKPEVISASLGICEPFVFLAMGPAGIETFERDLELAASAGISVLASAGDNGSSACQANNGAIVPSLAVSYPASSPFVTAVGGTNITLNRANGITSQVVWNDTYASTSAGGGGYSGLFDRPSYQNGVVAANARVLPDVSLLADLAPGYAIFCTAGGSICHGWTAVGGTSAAAPLLAGGLALVDQDLTRHHRAFLGLANPLIYRLATTAAGRGVFGDVTAYGNDLGPFLPGHRPLGCCSAAPGFDPASGWGSVNLAAFDHAAITMLPFAPNVSLRVPGGQRPLAAGAIATAVTCSSACRAFVTGEIVLSSTAGITVHSGVRRLGHRGTVNLRVPITAAGARRIRSAIRAGHHPFAELFGVALDAHGQPLRVSAAETVPVER